MKIIEYKLSQTERLDLRRYVDLRVHDLFSLVGSKGNTIQEDIDHAIRESLMDAAIFMFDRDSLASLKIAGGPNELAMTLFVFNNAIQSIHGRTRDSIMEDFAGSRNYILFSQKAVELIAGKYPVYVRDILKEAHDRIYTYVKANVDGENQHKAVGLLESYFKHFKYVHIHAEYMATA